jgi:hypothetical protein
VLILVTNDDGIYSPGLVALADRLARIARVVVVAPDRERSAVGHSLTLHSPLRAEEIRPGFFAVDGTPTDCVNLGIHGLLAERPSLVVSGINRGTWVTTLRIPEPSRPPWSYAHGRSRLCGLLAGAPSPPPILRLPPNSPLAWPVEYLNGACLPTPLNVNVPPGNPAGWS